jgi:sugar/nucleoside kinase (ribokinase family)
MFDVCCVGHMCVDILAKPVDQMPEKGKLQLIDEVHQKTGGCGMNTALDLSKLGISTAIIGKVGKDGFGAFIKETLARAGIGIDGFRQDQNTNTSASIVTISSDGERTILHCLGSNATLCYEDMDLTTIDESKMLFIGGTFLLPKFDGAGAARLLSYAQHKGKTRIMDTAWDASGQWLKIIGDCLPLLDWFVPSFEEASAITRESDPSRISRFLMEKGVQNVVVKLGESGCFVQEKNAKGCYVEPFKVRTIDTSGAGDAFCAGFITGLCKGWPANQCAEFGNAAGALCVSEIGTTTGIKSFEEVNTFIETYNNRSKN